MSHATPRGATARAALYLAVLSMLPGTAHSARISYDLGVLAQRSDNVGFTEDNRTSDTIISPNLIFSAEQRGSSVQFLVEGDVRYPHYVNDTFPDEVQGRLSGALDWELLPERLSFRVTDDLSRQSVNVLDSFVPSNQQQVNVFTAGPRLQARFGQATTGSLEMLYANTYAEESSEFQGDRYTAIGRLERQVRSTDSVSLNLQALRTELDDAGAFFDYNRYDAYVEYASTLAAIDLRLAAGYSRVEPRNYDADSTSPLFRADAAWRMSPRSTLSAGVNYEFADAAQTLVARQGMPGDLPVVPGSGVIDPGLQIGPQTFRQRRVQLGYAFESERMNVQISPYYDRVRYLQASTEDQDITALGAYMGYKLREDLTLSLSAVRQEREFQDLSRDDTNTLVNVGLARQLSRHWRVQGAVQRWDRDSSGPGQSYVENSVILSVYYRR